jgi:hypothetical protein
MFVPIDVDSHRLISDFAIAAFGEGANTFAPSSIKGSGDR